MKLSFTLLLFSLTLLPSTIAQTYKASFTKYGQGDQNGSPNCNTATAACGFYTYPGYNAAVSQVQPIWRWSRRWRRPRLRQLLAAEPPDGQLRARAQRRQVDRGESEQPLSRAGQPAVRAERDVGDEPIRYIPFHGKTGCAGSRRMFVSDTWLTGRHLGANVNFDTCIDDGASAALFGTSGVGLAVGTATKVSCSEWSGSKNIT
ncbi:hypothetical protein MMC15_003794 [Xylographa vitiligo]|nr:hypothetical protein [Xylographa vitiligo]